MRSRLSAGVSPPLWLAPSYGGFVPFSESPLHWLQSMWFHGLVVAAPVAAMSYRMTRATLARRATSTSYAARRPRACPSGAVRRHALPTALPAVLSLAAVNMALLIMNVVLVESAFNLPGFFRPTSPSSGASSRAP